MSQLPVFKNLEAYRLSKKILIASYELTQDLPPEEKTNFSGHIRKAALNLHINIAQENYAKKKKKKKFFLAAKNALIILHTATEMLVEVEFVTQDQVDELNILCAQCYELLGRDV